MLRLQQSFQPDKRGRYQQLAAQCVPVNEHSHWLHTTGKIKATCAAVGSNTEIGCTGPVQLPDGAGEITSPCASLHPGSKPLQEYAISLEMCLLTNCPCSLLWVKPNRPFGQLSAHFCGSLLHLCKIWQRFYIYSCPTHAGAHCLSCALRIDINKPYLDMFSITFISKPFCQVPWAGAVVRENKVQVLIMSLFEVFHGHALTSCLKMKHKPCPYFSLDLCIEHIPHPLPVFHRVFLPAL